jgi:ArsR family transcriptional regulator
MITKAAVTRERAAHLFHALSDETRIRIVERLRKGEQCVCELTDTFKTGQSRLSFHLRVLKEAGIVLDRPEGRWIYYSLNRGVVTELEELFASLFEEDGMVESSRDRCK